MENENRTAILAKTVRRYLNGYLWIAWHQNRIKDPVASEAVKEIERLEKQLKKRGVTPRQFTQLLNYGQIYKSLQWDKVTDIAMQQVMKVTFNIEI